MTGIGDHSDTVYGVAWRPCRRRPVLSCATVLLIAVMGSVAFGLSACGGGSPSPGIASVGSSSTTTLAPASTTSNASLDYSHCMRANGVPNFPDPDANGGFRLGAGIDPSSAEFKAAQAKCQKFMGVFPGAGSTTHPSAAALAQMLQVSQCMRRHGISGFPDPRTSVPSDLAGIGVLSDRDGVILVFPSTLDTQSVVFTRAAAACGFKLTNH